MPADVRTVQAAFEDLRPGESYGLVYAAAALHWTNPEGRWSRMAGLLEPGGVFAAVPGERRRVTMSARDHVGHLSTISAYLGLPIPQQEQLYRRIAQVLPETVEIAADLTVHLARRRREQ